MKNKKVKIITLSIVCILAIATLFFLSIILFGKRENTEMQEVEKEELIEQEIKVEEPLYEKEYSMHNGDIFVKVGDYIGYINKLENNSMQIINITNGETIKVQGIDRGLDKIYFDGQYFYGLPNHYSGKGIYKIDLQGNVNKIYGGESVQLWLTDDKIYFVKQNGFDEINQTPQGDLCYMDKNGKNITTVITNIKNYFRIQDDTIYYTDLSTRGLYKADIYGNNKQLLAEGRTYITGINKDYIVYIDYADGEAYHVLYLDDNTNHKVGRFGSSYITEKLGYVYTRRLTGDNNEIDVTFSLFKIDAKKKTEEQIFNTGDMTRISYVYKSNAFFTGSKIIKYNLKNNTSEYTDINMAQFLDGKAYEFKMDRNQKIVQIVVYNLDNNEKETIPLNYQNIVKETIEEKTENTTPITKEQAVEIWKSNIATLGKNNNIINYKDYTHIINITETEVKPNTQFTQSDNLPPRQSSDLREVWKIETAENEDAFQALDVYVDMYTGQIIGGRIYGD